MKNKLGAYTTKLMTVVLDAKNEDFVKQLAWDELNRLNVDLNEFLRKNASLKSNEKTETKPEKQLLQEDK